MEDRKHPMPGETALRPTFSKERPHSGSFSKRLSHEPPPDPVKKCYTGTHIFCSVEKIFALYSEALKGRQMIAQGNAAQRQPPWVTIPTNPLFSSFAPPERRMTEKGKHATACHGTPIPIFSTECNKKWAAPNWKRPACFTIE